MSLLPLILSMFIFALVTEEIDKKNAVFSVRSYIPNLSNGIRKWLLESINCVTSIARMAIRCSHYIPPQG